MSVTFQNVNGSVQVIEQGDGIQNNTYGNATGQTSDGIINDFLKLAEENEDVKNNLTDEQKASIKSVLEELDSAAETDAAETKKKGASFWLDKIKQAMGFVTATSAIMTSPCWGIIKDLVDTFINKL